MPFHVYLLECSDKSIYCGSTKNLEKRVELHNLGKAARYTRTRRPVKLVYSEAKKSRGEALKREIMVKKLSREQKLALVESFSKQGE